MTKTPGSSEPLCFILVRNEPEHYEFALLVLTIAGLAWLSLNLTVSGDLGRSDRYAGTHPDAVRMRWLLNYVGTQIAILGFSGWIVLVFGRRFQPDISSLYLRGGRHGVATGVGTVTGLVFIVG